MKKGWSILVVLNLVCFVLEAQMDIQTEYPEVGKVCPEFNLKNIAYFPIRKASLKDFRGKWLVLDFWNKGCGACVMSFPKTNELQKHFSDKIQFMLVGIEDRENKIRTMYATFREKENLKLPCAFDSVLANRFDVYTAPYIIVIDPNGIVQGITSSLDSISIQEFLSGKRPWLRRAYRVHEDVVEDVKIPFDSNKPFLINKNGGDDTDFLFRSVLSRWNPYLHHGVYPININKTADKGSFQVLGVSLTMLYNYAFFGKINPGSGTDYGKISDDPILEIHDSTMFQSSYKDGKNMFSYSLIIPVNLVNREERMERMMQRDLENYFGYEARIEVRMIPCYKLVASEVAKNKLLTHGGAPFYDEIPKANFKARNWPFVNLIGLIQRESDEIIFNETGIEGNIDIEMNCLQTDFNDIKRALKMNGLNLIATEKEMKVIVIKDKPENNFR